MTVEETRRKVEALEEQVAILRGQREHARNVAPHFRPPSYCVDELSVDYLEGRKRR